MGHGVMGRLTLLLNHVIGSEPIAMQRLQAHAGRSVRLFFDGWPSLLPALPELVFRITPAGLLEWRQDATADAELQVRVEASNPVLAMAQALVGTRPKVEVAGDAAFAADLNWLIDNLRWDVQDDLARIVGQGPAHGIARLGTAVAAGLRGAVRSAAAFAARRSSAGPPR